MNGTSIEFSRLAKTQRSTPPSVGSPNLPSILLYFDWATELTPKQILLIQVARPVPHRSNLAAVLYFVRHGFSDARVNLGVQNHNMRTSGPGS
jgi:hypothetical protein